MTRELARLTLEVDRAADPISGRLIDQNGTSTAFEGWLGLAAALSQLGCFTGEDTTDSSAWLERG